MGAGFVLDLRLRYRPDRNLPTVRLEPFAEYSFNATFSGLEERNFLTLAN